MMVIGRTGLIFLVVIVVNIAAFAQVPSEGSGWAVYEALLPESQKALNSSINPLPRQEGYTPFLTQSPDFTIKAQHFGNPAKVLYWEIPSYHFKSDWSYGEALELKDKSKGIYCFSFDKNGDWYLKKGSAEGCKNEIIAYRFEKKRKEARAEVHYPDHSITKVIQSDVIREEKIRKSSELKTIREYVRDNNTYTEFDLSKEGQKRKLATHHYDKEKHLLASIYYFSPSKPTEKYFSYDDQNRLTGTKMHTGADTTFWDYEYYDNGLVRQISTRTAGSYDAATSLVYQYHFENLQSQGLQVTVEELHMDSNGVIEDNRYVYLFDDKMNWLFKGVKVKSGTTFNYNDVRARVLEYH